MKGINRNPFMPLSTNSDAFRSPKKSVSKFDGFVCPQLYMISHVKLFISLTASSILISWHPNAWNGHGQFQSYGELSSLSWYRIQMSLQEVG